jgi:hypothetical protein
MPHDSADRVQREAARLSGIGCGKQSISQTVKPLLRTSRFTEMTDQFTGLAVDLAAFEIVKLLAGRIENLRADHDANEDALTVEYVVAHNDLLT